MRAGPQHDEMDVELETELASIRRAFAEIAQQIDEAQTAFRGAIMLDESVNTSLTEATRIATVAQTEITALGREMWALRMFAREWWKRNVDQPFDRDDGVLFDMAKELVKD